MVRIVGFSSPAGRHATRVLAVRCKPTAEDGSKGTGVDVLGLKLAEDVIQTRGR